MANGGASFAAGFMMHEGGWAEVIWAAVPGMAIAAMALILLSCAPIRDYRKEMSSMRTADGYQAITTGP